MSNHRSVHLDSGLLPLPLPLPFSLFPFALLSSSLPCLARQCLGTNEQREKKAFKGMDQLVVLATQNPLFTDMYLALPYTDHLSEF